MIDTKGFSDGMGVIGAYNMHSIGVGRWLGLWDLLPVFFVCVHSFFLSDVQCPYFLLCFRILQHILSIFSTSNLHCGESGFESSWVESYSSNITTNNVNEYREYKAPGPFDLLSCPRFIT